MDPNTQPAPAPLSVDQQIAAAYRSEGIDPNTGGPLAPAAPAAPDYMPAPAPQPAAPVAPVAPAPVVPAAAPAPAPQPAVPPVAFLPTPAQALPAVTAPATPPAAPAPATTEPETPAAPAADAMAFTVAQIQLGLDIGGMENWPAFSQFIAQNSDQSVLQQYAGASQMDRVRIAQAFAPAFKASQQAAPAAPATPPVRNLTAQQPATPGFVQGAQTSKTPTQIREEADALYASPGYLTDPAVRQKAQALTAQLFTLGQ